MGVILQAAVKRIVKGQTVSVPAPVDPETPHAPWWYDHIASQVHDLAQVGFTAILLPPVLKTSAGSFPDADGYGTYDDYDLGNKLAFASVPTRFGDRERLQRLSAIMAANGVDLYLDMVLHQRDGGEDYNYEYEASGGIKMGRFPKNVNCFFTGIKGKGVPRDPIAGPISDDFGFGDELAPINALPHDYVALGLIDAGTWITEALGAKGYRIDDVKGLNAGFVRRYLTSGAMAPNFAVGEYYDGNPETLGWWVWNSGMDGRCCVFDFGLRFILAGMCNNTSRWDMRQLIYPNYIARDGAHAVSFVENHDTDLDFPVIWNKILGYAFILTREGYPCVYYKDYSTDDGCYGLKPLIDNLVWIHEKFANGETAIRAAEYQYIVYERLGYEGAPGCLVGLNNDMYSDWMPVTVQTSFGPNVQLHDYTGNSYDQWTGEDGRVTIWLPPNDNGKGYVVFAKAGQDGPIKRQFDPYVSQVFEGADDLDIASADKTDWQTVARLWVQKNTDIIVSFDKGSDGLKIPPVFKLLDPDGNFVPFLSLRLDVQAVTAEHHGWYTLQVIDTEPTPFTATVRYRSTEVL